MFDEPPPPLAGSWDGALLRPLAEINQRMLESLQLAALAGAAEPRMPRLVMLLSEHWRRLDTAALQRLAGCPYLLVDAGFGQPERWEQQLMPSVREAPGDSAYFQGPEGIALIRRTLVFAWHLARSNRLGARVLLGMGARSAERIADSRLQDLDALAERGPSWILPRWEQQPTIWRQLIQAARGAHAGQLRLAQLRGLQLIAAANTGPQA